MLLTTLCYLEQDGKYLMLHRIKKQNDVNRDKWIGIGGKFEFGESPEDCLLREAYEETGYTLTDYRLRGIVTCSSIRRPVFQASRMSAARGRSSGCRRKRSGS